MKKHLVGVAFALAILAFISLVATSSAQQRSTLNAPGAATSPAGAGGLQRGPAVPTGPAPRLPDGKPDLSGVWNGGGPVGDLEMGLAKGETIPLLPAARKIMEARQSKDDPEANCLPTGIPRIAPYPWRIIQTPTHIFFLFEGNIHSYRQIFMDGRKHPEDPDPTWYGHSVARWEGDTLVVDSVGFNDKFWFDFAGHPHTEKLHVIERYRRPDFDHLEYETTIEDPGAYTKPFTMHGHSAYQHKDELMEYICNENNKDVSHIVGKDPRNKYSK